MYKRFRTGSNQSLRRNHPIIIKSGMCNFVRTFVNIFKHSTANILFQETRKYVQKLKYSQCFTSGIKIQRSNRLQKIDLYFHINRAMLFHINRAMLYNACRQCVFIYIIEYPHCICCLHLFWHLVLWISMIKLYNSENSEGATDVIDKTDVDSVQILYNLGILN